MFMVLFFISISLFSIYLGALTKKAIEKGEVKPVFENPSDITNSFYMLLLIIVGTVLVLLFVKVKLELVKLLENLAVFLLTTTTFSYFLPIIPSFIIALSLIIFSELKPSFLLKNICIFFSIPSAAAIIGASLDFKVLLIFFLILALYDIISVFVTKHMVYLAEKLVNKPTAFISVFTTKKIRKIDFGNGKRKLNIIALGAGDYFISASLSVSLLSLSIKHSFLNAIFNSIALLLLFYILTKRGISKPLPAIPFLFISSLLAVFISFYL